ncbi:MAG: short-chain dehydrogenase [Proteobacteria bacterium]|nr:short-chain dehydrogenase [Pseudomonadota bacterium]
MKLEVYMARFKGKHVLVTGAGSGIGKAISLRLSQEGACVSLVSRSKGNLEQTEQEIQSKGGKACVIPADICSLEQINEAVKGSFDAFGPLSAVVANSGVGGPNSAGAEDRFKFLVETNLIGTYQTLRAAQKYMNPDRKNARHMVVISSCLARFGVPGYTGYCASKAGLLGLVRALALELASEQIQVNAICPGWVETDMAREGLQMMANELQMSYDEAYSQAMSAVPLGFMNQPQDIAGMVSWLISTDARGVTGQSLDINAGSWM